MSGRAHEHGGCGPASPHMLRLTSPQICLLWSGPPSLTGCSPAEETRPGVTQGASKLQGPARGDEESFPRLWRQEGNTASMTENASGRGLGQELGVLNGKQEGSCVLGISAAQLSAGQCGAVNRSGQWWWTWQAPVLALLWFLCLF